MAQAGGALAKAPREAAASAAVQKDFSAFIARFRVALKSNDAAAVTGMTKLPFEDDDTDAAHFRTKGYPRIFTPSVRACIQRNKVFYDRGDDGNDYVSIFCGEVIFIFSRTQAGFLFTGTHPND
ncbi:hypothetical protein F0L46_10455 [Salinarimonas soli]|uniref:Uncharacterized protein n=1 Tax=Salinarimonas soli TaxID=1638099 RepID=A0A5B2VGX2_9HYPH|nr:hypothetical protein F0L46_10455 [Salinarimonas soli]